MDELIIVVVSLLTVKPRQTSFMPRYSSQHNSNNVLLILCVALFFKYVKKNLYTYDRLVIAYMTYTYI